MRSCAYLAGLAPAAMIAPSTSVRFAQPPGVEEAVLSRRRRASGTDDGAPAREVLVYPYLILAGGVTTAGARW